MIKLSQASFDHFETEAITRVLVEHQYLGMGAEVKAFEAELKNFIDPDNPIHLACVNTGTSALQLALQALGIGPGDEVLVPTLTYVASFQAISATGAKPVATDVDALTGFLCVKDAQKRLTKRTKAIMPVHYASGYGELEAVYAFAHSNTLRVVEDAAHAFGGFYKNKRVGAQGDIICFSFDSIKNITCGEGGAVVSRDEAVIQKVSDLRLLAVSNDTVQRFKGQRSFDLEVYEQGWRYHMSNLNAAIGRTQLQKIETFAKKRRELFQYYCDHIPLQLARHILIDLKNCVPHPYILILQTQHQCLEDAHHERDKLMVFLKEEGIETGLHYKPNHLLSYFKDEKTAPFPVAQNLWSRMITLPLHVNLSEDNMHYIVSKFKEFFKNQ